MAENFQETPFPAIKRLQVGSKVTSVLRHLISEVGLKAQLAWIPTTRPAAETSAHVNCMLQQQDGKGGAHGRVCSQHHAVAGAALLGVCRHGPVARPGVGRQGGVVEAPGADT